MEATLLASGLGFPEGPVVMPDGRIVFCDGNVGELLVYQGGTVSTFARTGGSPACGCGTAFAPRRGAAACGRARSAQSAMRPSRSTTACTTSTT